MSVWHGSEDAAVDEEVARLQPRIDRLQTRKADEHKRERRVAEKNAAAEEFSVRAIEELSAHI